MKRYCIIICAAVILIGLHIAVYFIVTGGAGGQGGKTPVPDAPKAPGFEAEKDRRIVLQPAPEFDEDGFPFRIVIEVPEVPERLLAPSPPIEEPSPQADP